MLLNSVFLTTDYTKQAASYDYPIADPIEASILSTPEKDRAVLPEKIRVKQYQAFDVFPDRDVPVVFWWSPTRFRSDTPWRITTPM